MKKRANGSNNLPKIIQARLVSLCLASQMTHLLQIEDKTLDQQKDCNSLNCGDLQLNTQYLSELGLGFKPSL